MGAEFRKGDPKNRELASQTNAAIPHEIHKAGGGFITKAEGGEAVGAFPGMKAMPKLANAGPVAQPVPMDIPRMQEVGSSGTGYGPNTPVIHPAPITNNYTKPPSDVIQGVATAPNLSNVSNGFGPAGSGSYGGGWGDANGYGAGIADISGGTLGIGGGASNYNPFANSLDTGTPSGGGAMSTLGDTISNSASNFGNNISDKFSNLGSDISDFASNVTNVPTHFSLGNAAQVAASVGSMTPLSIPIMLGNAILTGTNTIPEASSTGNPLLDKVATQGGATQWLAENVVNPVSRLFGGSYMDSATESPSSAGPNPSGSSTVSTPLPGSDLNGTSQGDLSWIPQSNSPYGMEASATPASAQPWATNLIADTSAMSPQGFLNFGMGRLGTGDMGGGDGGGGMGGGGIGGSASEGVGWFNSDPSKQPQARGGRAKSSKDARKALMIAKARGGSIEDEAIKAALKQVASPFSRNPEMRQHARRFVDTLKVPQGGETGSGSYYNIKQPVDVRDVTATVGAIPGVNPLQP